MATNNFPVEEIFKTWGISEEQLGPWLSKLPSPESVEAVQIFLTMDLSSSDEDPYKDITNSDAEKWILGRILFYGENNWSNRPIILDQV